MTKVLINPGYRAEIITDTQELVVMDSPGQAVRWLRRRVRDLPVANDSADRFESRGWRGARDEYFKALAMLQHVGWYRTTFMGVGGLVELVVYRVDLLPILIERCRCRKEVDPWR